MSVTVALHIFCSQVSKMCERKLVMNQCKSNCKVTENKRSCDALMLDYFKQWDIVSVDQIVLRHLSFAHSIFNFIISDN